MFETDFNLWLQAFASPWLTALMETVSFLGYEWFYIAATLFAAFALRLRPMLGVMLALLLAGVGTYAAKDGLQLPRPVQVDARVLDNGQANTQWLVERGGATSFATLPSRQAIDAERAATEPSFGFLSGHVASATALCASLWLFFGVRSRWIRLGLVAWPVLMALSRMYLGKHFPGDVLGGAAAGLLAAMAAHWLWQPHPGRQRAVLVLALALCGLSLAWPPVHAETVGRLLGLAAAAALLARGGFPEDHASWPRRAARVALALGLYAASHVLVGDLAAWGRWPRAHPMTIPLSALATCAVLYGTVLLATRLGCYRGAGSSVPPDATARVAP